MFIVGVVGEVYRGSLWGTDIAIKQLKKQQVDEDILTSLKHEVCTLYDLLHERSEPLNFGQILDMWTGIAQGLSYLHSLSRQIIHRDLKSQNVLVGGTLTPKVCDFGLSHVRQSLRKTSQEPQNGDGGHYGVFGTPEWMAPEIMEGSPYNASVDVYSFGIMMTEFLTRQLPFSDKYTVKGYRDIVTIVLDDGAIPTIPQWCGTFITSLIERCLHRNPQERPSFMEIIGHLRRLQSHRSSFFTEFDVPRMLDMILSTDRVTAALAARELASLSPGEVEKIPLETVNVFVARLSILMGIDILNLILNGRTGQCIRLFEAKYVDVDLASSTVPNGLFVFKDIIEETLSALEKARRQVEVDILQQQALMQRVSVCCTIMQSEKKKLEKIKGGDPPNVDREVRSHVRSARSASTNNEPPLLAAYRDPDAFTVVSQIPDTKLLGATFVGHFGTFQPTLHDNAVMLGPDGIWCDVFLFMFGTDIRVYDMFDATDPDDCVLIINTIDQTSGEIVAVSNASPFSHQPHCIAIAGSSDDSEMFRFAFRTRMKALRWAHRISPRLHDPAPSEHIVLAQKRKRKQYLRRVRRRHFMRSHIAFSSKDQLRDLVDGEGSDDQHHGVAGQYLLHIGVDDAVGRDLEDPPSAFVDYFGSLLRSKHGFALRWMDQANTTPVRSTFTGRVIPAAGGLWILVFLYLHGDVIRVYDSIQDEPDDPLACIYLTALDRFGEENPVSIAVGARHGRPHCIEIEEQTVFAFRSRSTALQWAELVNSVKSI
uniref:MAPKKK3 n=1 Tax=Plasmodiophora brassicae TaxID=37360 RepID=A0A2L2BM62_PLABS|nr:MAPKKK3 [Plasmodiophora brassicae]